MKTCRKCGVEKSLFDFYKDVSKKDKLTIYCKPCCIAKEKDYHKRNPVKKTNRKKNGMIDGTTGLPITQATYDKMLIDQHNKCAICENEMSPPCIDHNHATGIIRALLCSHCNKLLGNARENITILKQAIAYISKYN